ncbi:MAG: aminoglycoside phosphotransferase family protein [Candidatus Bathyarchaeota archaeon]|nr:aminoglycoside phosphotransferase family protein [Candidatus Bathyarchaeota archaeon]MCX8176802.1 aminoglycoside phosphotransferase family protein [Candidatus Bathyarchaeota archaeon]MDW8193331.1 phosphotransferase [Nitrososphaerota archaeon]
MSFNGEFIMPIKLSENALKEYLFNLYGCDVDICGFWQLGCEKNKGLKDLKGFGYGIPYVIEFRIKGETKRIVLETMRPGGFGHDFPSDRAQILLWQHSAFNNLPRHVRSVDVGAFTTNNERIKSLGDCREFFILTEYVEGKLYHVDLDRIKDSGEATKLDEERCLALSNYLAEIHSLKKDAPGLYIRRIRELVGHSECVMGLLDSYPTNLDYITESDLIEIERKCVEWRWRLKCKTYRLSQVHGDFHPWNIMFREGTDFTVLDRSRGEWGEPADDLTAITINYIFYSLQKYGKLTGVFERLFRLFWENYLQKTRDMEILEIVPPFYAWRGLVVASPIWYPNLSREVRIKLLNFVKNVICEEKFIIDKINLYIQIPNK